MDWQVINSARSRKYLTIAALLVALAAFVAGPGSALGDGKPDKSFGTKGVASFDPDPLSLEYPSDMQLDSEGRIVLGGTTSNGPGGNDAWFARLKRDGSLDPDFGTGGIDLMPTVEQRYVSTLTIDSEGRILAAGDLSTSTDRKIWILRMNPDGTPDPSFGTGGSATFDSGANFDLGYGAVVGKDGLIYLAGSTGDGSTDKATVVRFTPDGNPDPTWGIGGAVQLDIGGDSSRAEAIRLDRRGRVVLGGSRAYADDSADIVAIRLTRKGVLDKTFNRRGYKVLRFMRGQRADVTDMAIDGRGRIVLLGSGDIAPDGVPDGLLARLKPNGKPDRSFGRGGKVVRSIYGTRVYLAKLRIDRAGRILAAGSATSPTRIDKALLVRFKSDGRVDRSFGNKGQLRISFGEPEANGTSLLIDRKGRYLLAGNVFDTGLVYVTRRFAKYPRHK